MKYAAFKIHTLGHKWWVFYYILRFSAKLVWRGVVHDNSKYRDPEVDGYGSTFHLFKKAVYGTKDYDELLKAVAPAIQEHYRRNPHHPEHFENGYTDMNLLDFLEMVLDWKAASRKFKHGSFSKSLDINKERFKMSEDVYKILKNSLDI